MVMFQATQFQISGNISATKCIYRELKKSHIHLIKGKKAMQEKLLGLDEKCQNMMLLKFGREVRKLIRMICDKNDY